MAGDEQIAEDAGMAGSGIKGSVMRMRWRQSVIMFVPGFDVEELTDRYWFWGSGYSDALLADYPDHQFCSSEQVMTVRRTSSALKRNDASRPKLRAEIASIRLVSSLIKSEKLPTE